MRALLLAVLALTFLAAEAIGQERQTVDDYWIDAIESIDADSVVEDAIEATVSKVKTRGVALDGLESQTRRALDKGRRAGERIASGINSTVGSIESTSAATDTTDRLKEKADLSVWQIISIALGITTVGGGVMWKRAAGKASQFVKGAVDAAFTPLQQWQQQFAAQAQAAAGKVQPQPTGNGVPPPAPGHQWVNVGGTLVQMPVTQSSKQSGRQQVAT